jgi:DNA modification methylase
VKHWYEITIDDRVYMPISILRSKQGKPLQFTFKNGSKTVSKVIPDDIASTICDKERNYVIEDWYPQVQIIKNSRISARSEMTIQDLFTTRTLACHARLLSLIEKYSEGAEKDLLLMAFTANLANCSKLVPPIKSRGNLAQGAWMTGFYVGDTYIENNVMHYYENRLRKAIRGKENFLELINGDLLTNQNSTYYRITNFDAKNLRIPDNSIDYVFTDPPYGDSVPYFEQSIIWNSWLKLMPDYNNEIVISDSQERSKTKEAFEVDINQAFSEIHRVLKCDKYFSLTFHSLSGLEWKAVTNACIKNNFEIVDWNWLEQKTLPPRQLNRLKTIKGDVLVTFIKKSKPAKILNYEKKDFIHIINELITSCIKNGVSDTNGIMMALMEWILRKKVIVSDTDVFEVLNDNFLLGNDGK